MESRPVFADPSGHRHQVLRFAGFGAMAVIAVCLGALIVAMSGGPQAPFTQWAGPQARSSVPGHGNQPLGRTWIGHRWVSRSQGDLARHVPGLSAR